MTISHRNNNHSFDQTLSTPKNSNPNEFKHGERTSAKFKIRDFLLGILVGIVVPLPVYQNATWNATYSESAVVTRDHDQSSAAAPAAALTAASTAVSTPQQAFEERARLEQEIFCNYMDSFGSANTGGSTRSVKLRGPTNDHIFEMEVYARNDIVSTSILMGGWETQKTKNLAKSFLDYSKTHNVSLSELTFVDIGANVGWFTLQMAALGVQVVAIEPMDANLHLIRRSLCLEANKAFADRVLVFGNGLGTEKQTCVVHSHYTNIGDGHTLCVPEGEDVAVRIGKGYSVRSKIQVERLDDILSSENRTVVAVKMDTEGYEAHVVEGGRNFFLKSKIPHIFTEYSPQTMMREKGGNAAAFMSSFLDAGYQLRMHDTADGQYRTRKDALNVSAFPAIHDIIFDVS
jgi:FkbM family methyltransferase